MISYNSVLSKIEQPTGQEKFIIDRQSVKNIIKELIYCFKNYNYQAAPIAQDFNTGNCRTTCKNIYDFINKNLAYKAEPVKDQTSRSFSRIIHDKWGDCKHQALVSSCIAWNLGYDVILKVVHYKGDSFNRDGYNHIYTIVKCKDGNRYIIDPLQPFDTEKPYEYGTKYLAVNNQNKNNMALTRLSGTGNQKVEKKVLKDGTICYNLASVGELQMISEHDFNSVGSLKTFFQDAGKKVKTAVQNVKKEVQQHGGVVKTIALAPVRGAFSLLLLANVRNFAGRLKTLNSKDPNIVKSFATKFGYDYNTFIGQVNKGSEHKAVFGSVSGYRTNIQGVGSVSLAAAIAAAAPAIVALMAIFKKANLSDSSDPVSEANAAKDLLDLPEEGSKAAADQAKKLLDDVQSALKTGKPPLTDTGNGAPSSNIIDSIPTPVWYIGGGLILVLIGKKIFKL